VLQRLLCRCSQQWLFLVSTLALLTQLLRLPLLSWCKLSQSGRLSANARHQLTPVDDQRVDAVEDEDDTYHRDDHDVLRRQTTGKYLEQVVDALVRRVRPYTQDYVAYRYVFMRVLSRIECTKCILLRSMIPYACPSVMQAGCSVHIWLNDWNLACDRESWWPKKITLYQVVQIRFKFAELTGASYISQTLLERVSTCF